MEEVDSIIIHFLQRLNINIGDEIKTICDLPVETIVEAVSVCLKTINQSIKVPATLPNGISHRIEVAAHIATICKDLGYKNDVGYQTFLYYNEAELRQVFMFLIERLPNENKKTTISTETTSSKTILMQNISMKIGEQLNAMWIPAACNPPKQKSIGDFVDFSDLRSQFKNKNVIDDEVLIQKLLKMNINKENDNYVTINELSGDINEIKKEIKHEINMTLKELKETAISLRQKLDALESERNVMNVEYSQARKLCDKAESDLENVESLLNSIGLTEIEPEMSTDNILEKVEKNIGNLHNKSEELTSRNLALKVEIEKIRNSNTFSESERSKCKNILANLKNIALLMKEEYSKKEELRNELKNSNEKLKGGSKRSIYTKRILEIISNVDKQNMEIKKILEDTRQLQKEINSLEGQLDRCFSIADETLFRDAKRDDQAKKAYKLLALLHSESNTIVSLVNDTGTLQRDIVDLEDNIKAEKAKRTEDTLSKIQQDLARLQEEFNETCH